MNPETTNPETTARADLVAGLRALANYFERHPDVPAPEAVVANVYALDSREQLAAVARTLKHSEKEYEDTLFRLCSRFGGGVECHWIAWRDQICEKVIVGVEKVIETVPTTYEEREVEREIVEWRCGSLLADGEA